MFVLEKNQQNEGLRVHNYIPETDTNPSAKARIINYISMVVNALEDYREHMNRHMYTAEREIYQKAEKYSMHFKVMFYKERTRGTRISDVYLTEKSMRITIPFRRSQTQLRELLGIDKHVDVNDLIKDIPHAAATIIKTAKRENCGWCIELDEAAQDDAETWATETICYIDGNESK